MKRSGPLKRKTPLKATTAAMKRTRIRPRSAKMMKVYEMRDVLVTEILATQRACGFPDCTRPPTEVHERWTRARSGDTAHAILCRDNCIGLCHRHHRLITDDTKIGEALGLVRPSTAGCVCGYTGRGK